MGDDIADELTKLGSLYENDKYLQSKILTCLSTFYSSTAVFIFCLWLTTF